MAHVQPKATVGETGKAFNIVETQPVHNVKRADTHGRANSRQTIAQPVQDSSEDDLETPWQFKFVMAVIGVGVLGLVLKVVGVF